MGHRTSSGDTQWSILETGGAYQRNQVAMVSTWLAGDTCGNDNDVTSLQSIVKFFVTDVARDFSWAVNVAQVGSNTCNTNERRYTVFLAGRHRAISVAGHCAMSSGYVNKRTHPWRGRRRTLRAQSPLEPASREGTVADRYHRHHQELQPWTYPKAYQWRKRGCKDVGLRHHIPLG